MILPSFFGDFPTGTTSPPKVIYTNLNGTVRFIKKVYYGVNNVAKQILEYIIVYLSKTSTNTGYSLSRGYMATAAVPDKYALFGGGVNNNTTYYNTVDAFDTTYVRTNTATLSVARYNAGGAYVGTYGLFAGGDRSSTYYSNYVDSPSNAVDAYNGSLTRSNPAALPNAAQGCTGLSMKNYAIFSGGYAQTGESSYNTFLTPTVYNSSLTRSTAPNLLNTSYTLTGKVGNYGFFSPNYLYDGFQIEVYNTSLTKSILTTKPSGSDNYRSGMKLAEVDGYLLYGGGNWSYRDSVNNVDAFDTSLTMSNIDALSQKRQVGCGTKTNNYGLFIAGSSIEYSGSNYTVQRSNVDAYDKNLTHMISTSASQGGDPMGQWLGNSAIAIWSDTLTDIWETPSVAKLSGISSIVVTRP